MKKYRVGLIRVLTTDDTQLMQMHGALIEQYFTCCRSNPVVSQTSRRESTTTRLWP